MALLLLRYTVSHFSPYVFAVSRIALHCLKCLKKGPVDWAGGCRTSTLHCIDDKLCRSTAGVAATVSRVALHCATKAIDGSSVSFFC